MQGVQGIIPDLRQVINHHRANFCQLRVKLQVDSELEIVCTSVSTAKGTCTVVNQSSNEHGIGNHGTLSALHALAEDTARGVGCLRMHVNMNFEDNQSYFSGRNPPCCLQSANVAAPVLCSISTGHERRAPTRAIAKNTVLQDIDSRVAIQTSCITTAYLVVIRHLL